MQQLHAEQPGLLGSLCPGQKKLEGKTFYLDSVKKRSTALLLETISLLGGAVESFLHRDVSFVVTGSQEFLKDPKCPDTKTVTKVSSEEAQHPIKTRESVLSNDTRRLGTPRSMACCSRGKALLEKAIRNNEQLQKSSVLSNARSWGVKILYVDDVLFCLKQLTRERFSSMNKRPERTHTKQQAPRVVKAAALSSPYLKIEDSSRKYRPLHMQSMTFPALWYSGRFSPFESPPPPPPPPPPPRVDRQTEQGQNKTRQKKKVETSIQDRSEMLPTPSPWRPRRKDLSFCECCHEAFTNLEEHLLSDQHRAFVLDLSNYSVVDGCVAQMLPGFNSDPQSEETMNRPTPWPVQDVCELEPLTDAETEHAVQALAAQALAAQPLAAQPLAAQALAAQALAAQPLAAQPLAVQALAAQALAAQALAAHVSSLTTGSPVHPIPHLHSPPADILPFTTDTDCHPRSSSPTMPVLYVEGLDSAHQQPPCFSPDLYPLPPVLSPHSSHIVEPHSPYSEPPVLSPQWYHTAEEKEDGHTSVPVSTSHPGGSNPRSPSDITPRSRSLPQLSAMTPSPRKRCRSSSPEHKCKKRRRLTGKPGRTECAHPEVSLSPDKVSCDIIQSCSKPSRVDPPLEFQASFSTQDSLSTSVCIDSALIPTFLSQSSSDSDWDCELVSRLAPTTAAPLTPVEPSCELDKELLHRPGAWMQDASYESRLHTVLQPSNQGTALCGEEMEPSAFSRTLVHIVEVQH